MKYNLYQMFGLLLFSVSVGILYLCKTKSEEWEKERPPWRPEMKAISEVPKEDSRSKTKAYILVWTTFFYEDVTKSVFGILNTSSVHDLGCPKVDCVITTERDSIRDVDAVVFNQEDTNV
jgi:hypothetical protein